MKDVWKNGLSEGMQVAHKENPYELLGTISYFTELGGICAMVLPPGYQYSHYEIRVSELVKWIESPTLTGLDLSMESAAL